MNCSPLPDFHRPPAPLTAAGCQGVSALGVLIFKRFDASAHFLPVAQCGREHIERLGQLRVEALQRKGGPGKARKGQA